MTICLSDKARKELSRIDAPVRTRIIDSLQNRLEPLADPRFIGQAVKGPRFGEFRKYRTGDCRIICKIQDDALVILVFSIGHRREVYKG